jgi:hypothetical protein
MKPFVLRCLLTLLLLAPLLAVAADTGSRAFIERVRPEDFYDAEKLFPDPFSPSSEFVALRVTAGKPISALAIKRQTDAEGYTLTVQLASPDAPGGWLKIDDELDVTLGQQVLRGIEMKLHRQVTLSQFKRKVSKTDSDLWLYQRLSDGNIAGAYIAMEATIDNPAADTFITDLLGGLERSIGKEGAERAEALQKIDRIATDMSLAGSR